MLTWIIQITIISIILIFLIHYLINFFKSTLTVPKIKDLVNSPTQKYEKIYNTIKSNKNISTNSSYTLVDLLPAKEERTDMKNELKNFLKKQLQEPSKSSPLETISNDTSYASY